jgi:4-hydroxy 2-oxovalerate aldolase
MKKITISDHTLRDGNHAAKHKISLTQIKRYCEFAESANIPIVEVGHGNGLGASSYLVGKSVESDQALLSVARESLKKAKLAVHSIPGFATIKLTK